MLVILPPAICMPVRLCCAVLCRTQTHLEAEAHAAGECALHCQCGTQLHALEGLEGRRASACTGCCCRQVQGQQAPAWARVGQ